MRLTRTQPEWRQYYDELSTPASPGGIDRRHFLQGALAAGAIGLGGTSLFPASASAQTLRPDENILVVVLMGGGNDGFSMTIPADDSRYRDARNDLTIAAANAIPLAGGLYWNSNLTGLSERYNRGDVAVLQGVGDPARDLSHFSSMARWMRAASETANFGFTGWLGRYLDGAGLGSLGGVSIGDHGVPLHMRGNVGKVTALPTNDNLFGASAEIWEVPAFDALRDIRNDAPGSPWLDAVATTMGDAVDTAKIISPVFDNNLPEDHGIQRDLALAAETINLNLGARVLTVSFGDFDTHDDHSPRHQQLMANLDEAIAGFFGRLSPEYEDRVTLMTFSEFGRSWTSNDSAGIDHGTASTALVMGAGVRGGLYGELPDFDNLDENGDLISTVDFRSYFGTILDGWLGADSTELLGGTYEDLEFFSDKIDATCNGLVATIVGTSNDDVLNGTDGRDIIAAGPGDDVIYGLDGDDLICAGEGNDVIWGGAGNDEIVGAGGADDIRGEAGDDTIHGDGGNDKLYGGQGDDTIHGDIGDDVIHGNRGNDTLTGGPGEDRIFGYANDDTIAGGDGDDRLHGNFGNDVIHGNDGNDRIFGYGNDDELFGGDGNDVIGGNFGNDTIVGHAGNDRLYGSDGTDSVSGGAGNDIVEGNSGTDEIFGNAGDDTLDGGINADTCTGGPGVDSAERCEVEFGIE